MRRPKAATEIIFLYDNACSIMKSFLIGICGGSASGKTTLANELIVKLGKELTNYISMDDYYFDFISAGKNPAEINYDHPASIDIKRLADDLRLLRAGTTVKIPVYDFSTHTRKKIQRTLTWKQFTVVEGLFLFTIPLLSSLFNLKVYVDTPEDIRLKRRIERDTTERNRSRESVIKQYNDFVYPMHRKFVQPNKKLAGIILHGDRAFKTQLPGIMKKIN